MASLFELIGVINWEDLEGHNARESGLFEYSASKIENIMFIRELNRRLKVRPYHSPWLYFSYAAQLCWVQIAVEVLPVVSCPQFALYVRIAGCCAVAMSKVQISVAAVAIERQDF